MTETTWAGRIRDSIERMVNGNPPTTSAATAIAETAPLLFLDTETTGLDHDDEVWEIAAIRRERGLETPFHTFVMHDTSRAAALPESFRLDHATRFDPAAAVTTRTAIGQINHLARGGAHIVGAVPDFDVRHLARMRRTNGMNGPAPWHYHLIDVENLAVGWLAGRGWTLTPPWHSGDLSRAVGVEPTDYARHTAMGDVRWAMAIYDAVMYGGPTCPEVDQWEPVTQLHEHYTSTYCMHGACDDCRLSCKICGTSCLHQCHGDTL